MYGLHFAQVDVVLHTDLSHVSFHKSETLFAEIIHSDKCSQTDPMDGKTPMAAASHANLCLCVLLVLRIIRRCRGVRILLLNAGVIYMDYADE